ncbi:hypothetical protein KC360_g4979 [Hortaea werneckii]|nr:hypothetical protein KC325_g5026 [Hortaea werneckii]KAI6992384.1 hypothetical protein KC359_g5713 [Hortaea werneckii]KAI7173278.1 hypothetical protein KC360_g4979 [Hortaea werneckii]
MATHNSKKSKGGSGPPPPKKPKPSEEPRHKWAKCNRCKHFGHLGRDCTATKPPPRPKGPKCNLCKGIGHVKKFCPVCNAFVFSIKSNLPDLGSYGSPKFFIYPAVQKSAFA